MAQDASGSPDPGFAEAVMPRPTALIVEDDVAAAEAAAEAARRGGFDPVRVDRLAAARDRLSEAGCDLVVLDRGLADDGDGLDLLSWMASRELRCGVVVVSTLSGTAARTDGLRLGADDYVGKPFDTDELAARLLAVARRTGRSERQPGVKTLGPLELRRVARAASWAGRRIDLTPKLFDLLWLLTEAPGRPVSREAIWARLWPDLQGLPPQRGSIEAAASRLRRQLREASGEPLVESVRGHGYRLCL